MNKDLTQLIGKTISNIEWFPVITPKHYEIKHDDGDYLVITFFDGFKLRLAGNYDENWTGNSIGEYPTYLSILLYNSENKVITLDEQNRAIFSDKSNIEQPTECSSESEMAKDKDGQS